MTKSIRIKVPRWSGIGWVRLSRSPNVLVAVCVNDAVQPGEPPLPLAARLKTKTANVLQPVLAIYRVVSQLEQL